MLVVSEESSFLEALSAIAQNEAFKQLEGEVFEFGGDSLTGEVWAVDPRKNLTVELEEFELTGEAIEMAVKIHGRFGVKGSMKPEVVDIQVKVSAETDADIAVTGDLMFVTEGNEFFMDPLVEDLELDLDIRSLTPSSLSGGKKLLTRILNAAFDKRKKKILEQLNKSLDKYPLE